MIAQTSRLQKRLRPAILPPTRVAEPVEAPPPASCTLVLDSGLRLEMSSLPAPTLLAALVQPPRERVDAPGQLHRAGIPVPATDRFQEIDRRW